MANVELSTTERGLREFAESESNQGLIGVTEEGRLINNALRHARIERGLLQEDVAKAAGISAEALSHYENLRYFPSPENRSAIASYLGIEEEGIFPDWLKELGKKEQDEKSSKLKVEGEEVFSRHSLLEAQWSEREEGEVLGEPHDAAERREIRRFIRRLFEGRFLTEGEKTVLKLRYDLSGVDRTLTAVGKELGKSKNRIHQIEQQGLSKLRDPQRSRYLRDYGVDIYPAPLPQKQTVGGENLSTVESTSSLDEEVIVEEAPEEIIEEIPVELVPKTSAEIVISEAKRIFRGFMGFLRGE